MSFVHFLITCYAFTISHSHASREQRAEDQKQEFKFIKHYELIHVNLDSYSSKKIIEFDAFNRHYMVNLVLNTGLTPLVLRVHDNGTEEEIPMIHEPCYFNGREMSDDRSNVAISLCQNGEEDTGIIGWIKAFNETIYIKPTAYYTAPLTVSRLTGEHLVYRSSDYDWAAMQPFIGSGIPIPAAEQPRPHPRLFAPHQSRRRLAFGKVEVHGVIDSSWSLSKIKSGFNEANAAYGDSSLDSSNRLQISLSKTTIKRLSCNDHSSCLSKAKTFARSDGNKDDFYIYFGYVDQNKGKAYVGGICGSSNAGSCMTKKTWVGTCLVHELGHNLGAGHDGSNGYVMSPSVSTGTRDWSSQSNSDFKNEQSQWRKCISSGSGSGGNNNNDNDNDNNNNNNNNNNNGGSSACVKISDFSGNMRFMNGYWSGRGGSYTKDGSRSKKISQLEEDGRMYWAVNNNWDSGWCGRSSLKSCGGDWDTENDGSGLGSFRSSGSCKNSFTANECWDKYDDRLCVEMGYNQTEITDIFEIDYSEDCYNDEPVWRFVDEAAELVFYLHFNEVDEWVITEGGMMETQHRVVFVCEKSDLFECNDGYWMTPRTQDEDMIVFDTVDINIEQCGEVERNNVNVKSNDASGLIVVIVVLGIALVSICLCNVYKNRTRTNIKHINVDEDSADEEFETQEIVVTDTRN
eukprot:173108_1